MQKAAHVERPLRIDLIVNRLLLHVVRHDLDLNVERA